MSQATIDDGGSVARIALVRQAFSLGDCVDWIDDKAQLRVTKNQDNLGLTANRIKQLAITWVRRGNVIHERTETRHPYKETRKYWYMVILNEPGFPRGLFVEMHLEVSDPEFPEIKLLNAHPQEEGPIIWVPED